MTRISRGVIRDQPKSNTSRDDAKIMLKEVEANPMGELAIKPQVGNVDPSPNQCLS